MFHDVIPAGSARAEALAAAIPVKRLGPPDDVARTVMFFATPTACDRGGPDVSEWAVKPPAAAKKTGRKHVVRSLTRRTSTTPDASIPS